MVTNKKISVIIAAAGNASRLGQNISKQFIMLENKPLLVYSIEKLVKLENIIEIIVVTNDHGATDKLLKKISFLYNSNLKIKIALGGELRQDSVYNGFCEVDPSVDLVLIHDVARPLFNIKDTEKCLEKATQTGAAILAIPLIDTLKKIKHSESDNDELIVENTINREGLYLIQTPQVISYDLLSNVYKRYRSANNSKKITTFATDEATMAEHLGKSVNLILGSRKNIKITYPEDLEIAAAILSKAKKYEIKDKIGLLK